MGTPATPQNGPSRRDLLRYLGGGGVALVVTGSRIPAVAAGPSAPSDPVAHWIDRHAKPLHGVDPDAPLIDLRPLARRLRGATVVGLGAPYGAREPFLLRQRATRLLVEHLGFRAVALEEDWTKGIELDRYARTGEGDPQAMLSDAALPSRTEEVLDLVAWARAFNERHPDDPVRFVGSDVVAVRALAYDAVTEHVARVAPDRSEELAAHYAELRPEGAIADHVQWYIRQPDKQPYVDHARQAYELVAGLPPTAPGHALAGQHARMILGFYEYFATYEVGVRDRYMADAVGWWHDHVGAKVVYFASNVHTAVADPLTIHWGDMPPSTQTSAGGHLRARYGPAYRSVGVTFHHGRLNAGFPLAAHPVPAPAPAFLEAALGADRTYLLDLQAPLPRAVRRWLASPLRARAIGPFYDPAQPADYAMTSADPATWYDTILHTPTTTPTRPFA